MEYKWKENNLQVSILQLMTDEETFVLQITFFRRT